MNSTIFRQHDVSFKSFRMLFFSSKSSEFVRNRKKYQDEASHYTMPLAVLSKFYACFLDFCRFIRGERLGRKALN